MATDDRAPSFQFYPRDYLADGAVQGMSFDQQGRYVRSLCLSWDTTTPGEATEDQWRRWMCLTTKQWEKQRQTMAEAFEIGPDGVWRQNRMMRERAKQVERRRKATEGAKRTNDQRWGPRLFDGSHSDIPSDG